MHRIDGDGHVDNMFVEGNPSTGQEATRVTADFLNAVQEEIAGVIEAAGLTLDKENNAQLLAAILALAPASSAIRITLLGEASAVSGVFSALAGVAGTISEIGAVLDSGTSLSVTVKNDGDTVATLTVTTSFASVSTGLSNTTVSKGSVLSLDTASPTGTPTGLKLYLTINPS